MRLERVPAEPVEHEQHDRGRRRRAPAGSHEALSRRRLAADERRDDARERRAAVGGADRLHLPGPPPRIRRGYRSGASPLADAVCEHGARDGVDPVKVSTRGDYAARALLSLALHGDDRPTSVKEIAERTNLPQPYLEQILLAVKGAGLVRSKRGVGGGYVLARPPEEITVAEILAAVDGPLTTLLGEHDHCEGHCVLQEVWVARLRGDGELLEGYTLADLVGRTRIGHPEAGVSESSRRRSAPSADAVRPLSRGGRRGSASRSGGSGSSTRISSPVTGWRNASSAAWRNGRSSVIDGRRPAVGGVADDRMVDRGEVHADLVGATGLEPAVEQAHDRARERLERRGTRCAPRARRRAPPCACGAPSSVRSARRSRPRVASR